MVNDAGGIAGRRITFISLDDGYIPPKAVLNTQKLVEQDGVAVMFGSVGTGANTAVQRYLNDRGVPQLFVASGADKWADPAYFPWTIGWQPSYRTEAKIFGKFLLAHHPRAKVCVLYQNDDFGKDYLVGLREGLAAKTDAMLVGFVSYDYTDPNVDAQIESLHAARCDTLIGAATPKFAALAIRNVADLHWHPMFLLSSVSVSISAVFQSVGLDKATGIITGAYLKTPSDPALANDPEVAKYRRFMASYAPSGDPNDANYVYAYAAAQTLVQVFRQCGNDLSRDNVMKQAASLSHFVPKMALRGIEVNTSPGNFRPITRMQLAKFDGTRFVRFGEVIDAQ